MTPTDYRGRTIDDERASGAPDACAHDPSRIRTIGRHYLNARRWSWATRFEIRGDMSVKDLSDGSRFVPVEQIDTGHDQSP